MCVLLGCSCVRLNESPSEKEGKSIFGGLIMNETQRLNESPSEKEGKFLHQ